MLKIVARFAAEARATGPQQGGMLAATLAGVREETKACPEWPSSPWGWRPSPVD
jgi:hypothetical protein